MSLGVQNILRSFRHDSNTKLEQSEAGYLLPKNFLTGLVKITQVALVAYTEVRTMDLLASYASARTGYGYTKQYAVLR